MLLQKLSPLFLAVSVAVLSAAPLSASAGDDHHASSPSFKRSDVTGNIQLLQGKGGNIAVLSGDQGLLMVDSDYHDMSDALKKALKPFGGTERLTYIINTHWHGDHTGGNLEINAPAAIVAHDNVRTRLLSKQEIKLFKMVSEPYPEKALPSVTYQQSMNLYINGEKVNIVHFPNGHTDGDSVVFFKNANVVHMGDHYFAGVFPFVDVGTGGNVLKMAENIKQILGMIDDKTKIIPGHGPLSSKKDLENYHAMLIGTAAEVKAMKAKGMSLAQMQEQGLSSLWDDWSGGFIKPKTWIGIVYNSL